MPTKVKGKTQADTLLQAAAEWRLLGLLFEAPDAQWKASVRPLLPAVKDRTLRAAGKAALQEAKVGLYFSTLGPGGPAQVREAAYRRTLDLGTLMADIEAYYTAFAFQPRTAEPCDHLAVEAAFISYLHLKEAYALFRGADTEALVAREAAQEFIREHLAYIAEPLAKSLQSSGIKYMERAARHLLQRVGPAPVELHVVAPIQPADADEEVTCAM